MTDQKNSPEPLSFFNPADPPQKRSVEMLLPRMFGNRVQYRPETFGKIMERLDALTRE